MPTKRLKKLREESLTRARRAREKTKAHTRKLKDETKKALSTAIVAAFGFVIALTWKDVIIEYVDTLLQTSPIQGKFVGALIVTVIAVIGILIITKTLSIKE